jgi:hypothetical protein
MSHNSIQENEDEDLVKAKKISQKGWRQGAIFDPRGFLNTITIAEDIVTLEDDEFLIICTQSCTLVSRRFEVDPYAEAMIVKLVNEYNPRSQEATGKNQRKLRIKLINHSKYKCIECDINKRFSFNRKRLLEMHPSKEFILEEDAGDKLAGWYGRSITRIALPDLLVERMGDISKTIKKCLEKEFNDDQGNYSPLHESVLYNYIDWQPRKGGNPDTLFLLRFIFLCSTPECEENLDQILTEKLKFYQCESGKDGVKIVEISCKTDDSTFVRDLHQYERLSDLDYLSDLGEISKAPPGKH